MKILLIYPTTTSNGIPEKYRKVSLPPLNLALLDRLTELANPKHQVKIINEYVENIDFDMDVDLVGITALTPQAVRAYQIADTFRAKGKKVILGGVHPSLLPEEAQNHADSILIGEAEDIWADILADFENGREKPVYQSESLPDLTPLVIPKWDNMDLSVYRRSIGRTLPRMPIYTTRGCVFDCDFCSVSKFFGRTFRTKPIENVLMELAATNAESYFFADDNIICNRGYSIELFKAISSSVKQKIRWFCQASTTLVNQQDLIPLAAKAGCKNIFFGVESIHSDTLESVNKKMNDPMKYVELYHRCSKEGIQPWYSFIFGFDSDTRESVWDTIAFLKKHNIWNVVFWVLTPLPSTKLYQDMADAGRIIDSDWSHYDVSHVVFQPKNFSVKELQDTFWQLYKSMYSPRSVLSRSAYTFKHTKFVSFLNSFVAHNYYRMQINKLTHPYEMGLFKYGKQS